MLFSRKPELNGVLSYHRSWLNPTLHELFQAICLLKPGFYVKLDHRYRRDIGFQVSKVKGKLSLTHFCTDSFQFGYEKTRDSFYKDLSLLRTTDYILSILDMIQFFKLFLKNYTFCDHTIHLYRIESVGYFYVRHSRKDLQWINGRFYVLQNNKCLIKYPEFDIRVFITKSHRVQLRIYPHATRQVTMDPPSQFPEWVEPLSMKSNAIDVHRFSSFFKVEFLMEMNFFCVATVMKTSLNNFNINERFFITSMPDEKRFA